MYDVMLCNYYVMCNVALQQAEEVDPGISDLDDVLKQLEDIQTGGLASCTYVLCNIYVVSVIYMWYM